MFSCCLCACPSAQGRLNFNPLIKSLASYGQEIHLFSFSLCLLFFHCTLEMLSRLHCGKEAGILWRSSNIIKIKPFILFSSFLIQTLYLSINHSYGCSQIPSFQLYSSPKKMNKPMSIFRGQSHAFPWLYLLCMQVTASSFHQSQR